MFEDKIITVVNLDFVLSGNIQKAVKMLHLENMCFRAHLKNYYKLLRQVSVSDSLRDCIGLEQGWNEDWLFPCFLLLSSIQRWNPGWPACLGRSISTCFSFQLLFSLQLFPFPTLLSQTFVRKDALTFPCLIFSFTTQTFSPLPISILDQCCFYND